MLHGNLMIMKWKILTLRIMIGINGKNRFH
jgi:hypothetical protein